MAAPPTMNTWPCTPRLVSSSPSACRAAMIFGRLKLLSGTIERFPCDEDAMPGERRRSLSQHVGVEGGPAGDEPPRFGEPSVAVDPLRYRDLGLGSEELGQPGDGRVESQVPGQCGLLADQRDLPGPRGSAKVVGEAEQEPGSVLLLIFRQVQPYLLGELAQ